MIRPEIQVPQGTVRQSAESWPGPRPAQATFQVRGLGAAFM